MDNITQARHNFVLAFQYCWNGKELPTFREIRLSEFECIHTGYCAIDLLDEALDLHPNFQESHDLRSEIWHIILTNNRQDNYGKYLLFDDSVLEKHYAKEIAIAQRQYSGNAGGIINGIGIVTCVYVNPELDRFWVIDYRIYDPRGMVKPS